jgi:hypothetical protein
VITASGSEPVVNSGKKRESNSEHTKDREIVITAISYFYLETWSTTKDSGTGAKAQTTRAGEGSIKQGHRDCR